MAEATRIEDLCCTLYDMLASVKSGDELQDEGTVEVIAVLS